MGIFSYFKRKKKISEEKEEQIDKGQITRLTTSIRKQRIEYLRKKLENIKQKQEEMILEDEISDLTEEYEDSQNDYPDDELDNQSLMDSAQDNPEALFTSLIMKAMSKNPQGSPAPPPIPQAKKDYSDDEIKLILANTGTTIINQIKGQPDDVLKKIILNKYPDASDVSVAKTIQLIKES